MSGKDGVTAPAKESLGDRMLRRYVQGALLVETHQGALLFLAGTAMLLGGLEQGALAQGGHGAGSGYDGSQYDAVCNSILGILEGEFGSLLTASAGLGAIVASATGAFRTAWTLLVVSVGSFILREYRKIWFEDCAG